MHGTAPTTKELIARNRDARYAFAARHAHQGTSERNGRPRRFTIRRRGDAIDN